MTDVHVPAKGWAVWVVHPDTDRVLQAEVASDPRIDPSLNSLPRIQVPVPKSPQWQDLSGEPTMNVFLDGEEQPIDELTKPVDAKDAATTVLEGQGGVELLERVAEQHNAEQRHVAAEALIDDHTTYTADVPTPDFDVLQDEELQSPTTNSEFNDLLTWDTTTTPLTVANDDVADDQTCFTTEAEGTNTTNVSFNDAAKWSGNATPDGEGRAVRLDANGEKLELTFNLDYTIPADDFGLAVRVDGADSGNQGAVEYSVNGENLGQFNGSFLEEQWRRLIEDGNISNPTSDLPSGSNTVTIEATGSWNGGTFDIDVIAPHDRRFSYTFDNTLEDGSDGGRYLDGPQFFPDGVDATFQDATSTFSVIAATVNATLDNTENGQRIQVSNNRAEDWFPDDGSEQNTSSVTVDPFTTSGTTLRTRITLSRHSPDGDKNQTPRTGYEGQTLSDYTMTADLQQESLLLDYSETQSLRDHLTQIAGDEFFWSYRIDGGDPTLTFIQPGARTGDDPDLVQATVEKDLAEFHKFTVFGANKRVSDERFNASTSFVALNNDDIVPGSETVRDPDTGDNFDRGADYEVDWQPGEIKAVGSGDLTSGDEFAIDYRFEVSGSFEDPDAPADFRERDVDIPAVTSQTNAEQIAYVLVEVDGFNAPRYAADVTVPPSVATFDVVEALPLDTLEQLPDDLGPLEVEEPPRVTPRGTEFVLGTRPPLEERLSELRSRVQQVARRSG